MLPFHAYGNAAQEAEATMTTQSDEIRFAIGTCSLGSVLVAASVRGVCAVLIGEDDRELRGDLDQRFKGAPIVPAEPAFATQLRKVIACIETPALPLDVALDVRGTTFQRRVWDALQAIPAGETRSYTQIAQAIGAPAAVRAVAAACAANAIAVLIPCHRVVRGDGSLSGYRWGVDRKRELLAREHQLAMAA